MDKIKKIKALKHPVIIEGREAFGKGVDITDNPYSDCLEKKLWQMGWNQAKYGMDVSDLTKKNVDNLIEDLFEREG